MKKNSNYLNLIIIIISAIIIYSSLQLTVQNRLLNDYDNPCIGVIGYSEVMYMTKSYSDFESIAHYKAKCLFFWEIN